MVAETNKSYSEPDVDPDTVCGIGSFRPRWLQPWATERVYLVLYAIIGILSGSFYPYLIGSISTLEKRFAFKSKLSGTVLMVDDVTPLLLGVLVGYYGGMAHRPRILAFGMVLSSLACFVSAMPFFIYGAATHMNLVRFANTTAAEFEGCELGGKVESCDVDDRPPTLPALLFLVFGGFLKGFGNMAYYVVGLAYMDDNSKKEKAPMNFALTYAFRFLGPMLGYFMSYTFLKYSENPFADPEFGPEDPRFIGGWWMGFMLQGALLLVFSAPIALFPRRLPGHQKPKPVQKRRESVVNKLTGLLAALKRLGKNPIYAAIVMNTIFTIYGSFGYQQMLPKYMENQFRVTASQASLLSGPPTIVALIISTLAGGYLINRFKSNAKVLTRWLAIAELLGALGFLILMMPRCESIQMSNYGLDGQGLILESSCNTNCTCSTKAFTPVCAPDGITHFFSPCHAGCQEKENGSFTECSCIADSFGPDQDSITQGFCISHGCWTQAIIYAIITPVIAFIINLPAVAKLMVLMRCIKIQDKSIALGTLETLISALGFIPFPIVFGTMIDYLCLIWEKSCGQTGNCWFYDITKFNYVLHGSSGFFSMLAGVCMFVVFLLSDGISDLYREDEDTAELPEKQDLNP